MNEKSPITALESSMRALFASQPIAAAVTVANMRPSDREELPREFIEEVAKYGEQAERYSFGARERLERILAGNDPGHPLAEVIKRMEGS